MSCVLRTIAFSQILAILKIMGGKDIAQKNLEDWNDVFADIVNVLLFNGENVVKEEDLEADTLNSQFKADDELHEQERDVSKIWKNGEIRISILGFENQTKQDYKMPLRVISYDGASYKKQLLDKGSKENYPVATLVLYFGTESKWTAPKKLYECFNVPKELKPFVNDYKINVFEIAWLDDETISKFKSDFKFVAKYFQIKRLHKEYVPTKEEIQHVDSLLKLFAVLTGDDSFEKVYNEGKLSDRGGVTMCDIVEDFVSRGIQKGINQGIAQGIAQGITQGIAQGIPQGIAQGKAEVIRNLIEAKAGSIEQIATWVKLPVSEVISLAEKVPVQA